MAKKINRAAQEDGVGLVYGDLLRLTGLLSFTGRRFSVEVYGERGTGWAGKVAQRRVPLPPAEHWLHPFVQRSAEEVEKVGQALRTNTPLACRQF